MALFNKKEFAGKCGITTKELSVYISRGKVVVGSDSMIDDVNALNVHFFNHCQVKKKKRPPTVEQPENPQKAQISEKKPPGPKEKDKYDERYDLENEKKRMEIEKLQRDARVAEVQHLKLMGKMLPTDPVRTLFIQTVKAYTVSFKQAAERIILEYAAINKMNRNDLAQMKGELIAAINHAAEEGNTESKKSINAIIREYSQAKK